MKISTLLSLAFACTVSASTYGQNYKLSMNKQDLWGLKRSDKI